MNKFILRNIFVMTSLLGMITVVGCSADGEPENKNNGWVQKEQTVTLTYPTHNVTTIPDKNQMNVDQWYQLGRSAKIEIPDENAKEVDMSSLYVYWTDDTTQYRVNCSIWLYEWSEQKITIYYYDLVYSNSFENRHNPAPDPLGTVENPVVFDLKISYKVKY